MIQEAWIGAFCRPPIKTLAYGRRIGSVARAYLGWTREQLADRAIVALNTVAE